MIVLSLDFETTGLDFEKDRIIEIGASLYSTGQKKCLDNQGCLVKADVPVTPEITAITNITQSAVDKFGYEEEHAFENLDYMISEADAIIGHNVLKFDKIMLQAWAGRLNKKIEERLWIDTMIDIKGHEGKKLSYLAADHGILNYFPHSALADAQTVLVIARQYDINILVERAKTPTVIIQAHHKRTENDLVKKQKFRWNPDHKVWWKAVKETDVEELEKACNFPIGYASKDIMQDLLSC